jgi:ParB family chromosome partitioning protein
MPKLMNISQHTGTEDSQDVALCIKDLPIGEIFMKANVRNDYEGIDELEASIRRYGLLQPITVYRDGDAYTVKTGHRRLLAFKSLYEENPDKYHCIRCIISDAADIQLIQLIENVQRVDLSQLDLYNALTALKNQGLTLKHIAGIMGKSEKYIKNIFTAVNEMSSNEDLKNYLSPAGGTIQDIAETAGIPDQDKRLDLLTRRKAGTITRAELRERTRELKTEGPHEVAGGPAGGTIGRAAPPEPEPHIIQITSHKEQRTIILSYDDDRSYTRIYTELKKWLEKRHFRCIETEAGHV